MVCDNINFLVTNEGNNLAHSILYGHLNVERWPSKVTRYFPRKNRSLLCGVRSMDSASTTQYHSLRVNFVYLFQKSMSLQILLLSVLEVFFLLKKLFHISIKVSEEVQVSQCLIATKQNW